VALGRNGRNRGFPNDFAAAFEASFARFQIRVEEACAGQPDWPSQIAAAIRAGLEFASADPAAANLLTNEALASGVDGIARHRRLLTYVAESLAAGRQPCPRGGELPQLTEQALAGGLLGFVAERLNRGKAAELPQLAAEAVQFALTPYLGVEGAKRLAASG
jgi:AcrR family transcriptional regulator